MTIVQSAIVWDVLSGEVRHLYTYHKAPTLDVDWQNNTTFSSCSADTLIHVFRLGTDKPIRTFSGHKVIKIYCTTNYCY